MFALSFIYIVFISHLTYLVVEKKDAVFRDRTFWLLIVGLCISLFITTQLVRP